METVGLSSVDWYAILGWGVVILLFVVGMLGAVYPILPSTVAVYAAFIVYGLFFGFGPLGLWFWILQTLILVVTFIADYVISALGVKKFGGSRAAVIGCTIGLIVGPFVIPVLGLILGPFIGAIIGELVIGTQFKPAVKAGVGSVLGFLSSVVVKIVLQAIMIAVFVWQIV